MSTAETFDDEGYYVANWPLFAANLPRYAEECLKIHDKQGNLRPLIFNKIQRFVHEKLEEQKARIGKVRAIVLKGRKGGVSTYVAARYFQRTNFRAGTKAYIMSHEDESTKYLAGMADTMHKNLPDEIKPKVTKRADTVLEFGRMDSGYSTGTAKSEGTGRGRDIHCMHCSEVAFWPQSRDHSHAAGAMQAVPNLPGTEIILESTANGMDGMFYQRWKDAESGQDPEYIAIFVPWFWDDDLRSKAPNDFLAEPDEVALQQVYGLSDDQLYWRRAKIKELGSVELFKQEYPSNAEEAFQASGQDVLIRSELVAKARKTEIDAYPEETIVPIILGCDIALGGKDRTKIIDRQGRRAGQKFNITMHTQSSTEIANRIAGCLDDGATHAYIDVGAAGGGPGVVDILKQLGYGKRVTGVNFGAPANDPETSFNKRAEVWRRMAHWLEDPAGVMIPDSDVLHRHLCASPYVRDAAQRIKLAPKDVIKTKFGFSPDEGDALALTFTDLREKPNQTGVEQRLAREKVRRRRYGRVGGRYGTSHSRGAYTGGMAR